jgi:hypothetical protein
MPTQPYYIIEDDKKVRVPSVTTITGRFKESGGLIHWAWQCGNDGVDYRDARDAAASAGTIAHGMIERFAKGEDPDLVECEDAEMLEKAKQGFRNFKLWFSSSRVEILETEIPLVSETYRFGGCPDGLGTIGNDLTLLDWKTGNATYIEHIIQVRAYGHLIWENNFGTVDRYDLCRFSKEGASFHHSSWSAEQLGVAWDAFLKERYLYDDMKTLKGLL